jgi:hypothetical protein
MRVPAAQVHLNHADPRLDQTAGHQKALAPLLATVLVAHPVRLLAQVEGVVLAGPSCQEQLHCLEPSGVPGRHFPQLVGTVEAATMSLQPFEQGLAVLELGPGDGPAAEVG